MPLERAVLSALGLLNSRIIDQDQHWYSTAEMKKSLPADPPFQLKLTPFEGVFAQKINVMLT